jgi:hypothetical protein
LTLEELIELIQEEPPDRELERELRWYLDGRSRSTY